MLTLSFATPKCRLQQECRHEALSRHLWPHSAVEFITLHAVVEGFTGSRTSSTAASFASLSKVLYSTSYFYLMGMFTRSRAKDTGVAPEVVPLPPSRRGKKKTLEVGLPPTTPQHSPPLQQRSPHSGQKKKPSEDLPQSPPRIIQSAALPLCDVCSPAAPPFPPIAPPLPPPAALVQVTPLHVLRPPAPPPPQQSRASSDPQHRNSRRRRRSDRHLRGKKRKLLRPCRHSLLPPPSSCRHSRSRPIALRRHLYLLRRPLQLHWCRSHPLRNRACMRCRGKPAPALRRCKLRAINFQQSSRRKLHARALNRQICHRRCHRRRCHL